MRASPAKAIYGNKRSDCLVSRSDCLVSRSRVDRALRGFVYNQPND